MNQELQNAIVDHIFQNLGLYGSIPISIMHDAFLTDEKITFEEEEVSAPVFACQTVVEGKKLGMICAIFSPDQYEMEGFVVIKLEGMPAYGARLNRVNKIASGGIIAVEIKPKVFIPTSTFLQATFLAGLEQLKELFSKYEKAGNLEELFLLLKEFIAFCEAAEGA